MADALKIKYLICENKTEQIEFQEEKLFILHWQDLMRVGNEEGINRERVAAP